jgi:glycosyltransferase involved in cell wall biosynthesis
MRVYMNFTEVRGPYGGANSFLRTLRDALVASGVAVTNDVHGRYDIALLNALTDRIDVDFVRRIAERGIPIVHRKVGYRVSGSAEMRSVSDGVVHGDALQIAFTPYLTHSIFQSNYSRDVFLASGFNGPFTVIHNGVDERVFNFRRREAFGLRERQRTFWSHAESVRVVVSSWSPDPNKGFVEYTAIDKRLGGRHDVNVTLVGQLPKGLSFTNIRYVPPVRTRKLAELLKRHHVLLQLARYETCSNALIEGLNCGLPAIYLDSGSNAEIAADYGIPYEGDFDAAVAAVLEQYDRFIARLPQNPFRISVVLPRYLEVLEEAAARA